MPSLNLTPNIGRCFKIVLKLERPETPSDAKTILYNALTGSNRHTLPANRTRFLTQAQISQDKYFQRLKISFKQN